MKLIDRDALIVAVDNGWQPDMMVSEIWDIIDEQPIVDAVPIVRCKDCAHCEIWKHPITNNVMYFCTPTKPHITDPDGYCEKGEKRNAEID